MHISRRFSRAIALSLAFVLLAALVIVAEIGQSGQKEIDGRIGMSQKRQVLLSELLEQLSQAEAAQRGYLLTGDHKYLQPYQSARDRVEPTLDQFGNLFRDEDDRPLGSTEQRNTLRHMRVLIGAKLAELSASLELYRTRGAEQAIDLVRTELSSGTMTEIRASAAALRNAERNEVNQEIGRAERLRWVWRVLMSIVVLLNIILLIVSAALLARQARRRAELTEQLATENEELERRVRRRTSELSALSSHLQQLSEKEKASLARELHDELGGLLIAAKMDVSWLQKRSSTAGDPDIQNRWVRVLKVLDEGVDFKRRIVERLRPTLLDNMGLLPAVRWITEETCTRAGLHCTEAYPEMEPLLADDAAIMVFRLVQEALTNIVKHARASEVTVQIAVSDTELTVVVADNGVGIASDRRDAIGSHGLATMRHRVRSFGGNLEIETMVPSGTRLRSRLPLALILRPQQPAALQAPVPSTAGVAPPTPLLEATDRGVA
ncbi:MAG: CHASE3 domain-containing protein [Steroidobacteraceae bacterium]